MYEYEIQIPFGTSRQHLRPTPPPPGLCEVLLGSGMNIFHSLPLKGQLQCDSYAELLLELE